MNRSQQSLSLKLLILLTATAAIFLLISNRVQASTPDPEPLRYRVQAGDTLWRLATSIDSRRDVRALVADIGDLNGLQSSLIHPGQILLLPAT